MPWWMVLLLTRRAFRDKSRSSWREGYGSMRKSKGKEMTGAVEEAEEEEEEEEVRQERGGYRES